MPFLVSSADKKDQKQSQHFFITHNFQRNNYHFHLLIGINYFQNRIFEAESKKLRLNYESDYTIQICDFAQIEFVLLA